MSTEQIVEDDTTTDVVDETEQFDDYWPPMITISKTTVIGEVTDTLRVELNESETLDSPGAVMHLVEVTLRALQEEPRAAAGVQSMQLKVSPLAPGFSQKITEWMERADADNLDVADLEAKLQRAREHDQDCPNDHTEGIHGLHELVEQARAGHASSQASPVEGQGDAVTDGGNL